MLSYSSLLYLVFVSLGVSWSQVHVRREISWDCLIILFYFIFSFRVFVETCGGVWVETLVMFYSMQELPKQVLLFYAPVFCSNVVKMFLFLLLYISGVCFGVSWNHVRIMRLRSTYAYICRERERDLMRLSHKLPFFLVIVETCGGVWVKP